MRLGGCDPCAAGGRRQYRAQFQERDDPLQHAAENYICEAMLALLEKAAAVDARDIEYQFVPLHQACSMHGTGVGKAVELLLRGGVRTKLSWIITVAPPRHRLASAAAMASGVRRKRQSAHP